MNPISVTIQDASCTNMLYQLRYHDVVVASNMNFSTAYFLAELWNEYLKNLEKQHA